MDLSKSTAIITGGAHRVGRGIALSLAGKGCNIIVHYGKSHDRAKQTVSDLQELGVEANSYSADLGSPDEIIKLIDEIDGSHSYQILVNSAASFVKESLGSTTLEQWDKSINLNLRAPFMLTQLVSKKMTKNDNLIVNISDLSGIYPWLNFASHSISKSGLIHLTKVSARELAPKIRVNAIIPGAILPPPQIDESSDLWQTMINNIPLQKSGFPKQIGETTVYMATNEFLTGAIINVDGGEGLVGPKSH